MYWRFNSVILPSEATITQERSPSGDDCHQSISDTSDKKLIDIITKVPLGEVTIVDCGVERAVTLDDIRQDKLTL